MILDILIAVVVIMAMVLGFRAGFLYTFLHTIGWIISLVLAFVWTPKASGFLLENTNLYERIHGAMSVKFADAFAVERLAATLPSLLKDMISSLSRLASEAAANAVSDFLFAVTAFLLMVILIKLALFFLISLLSKKKNAGFRGVIDGLLGLIMGFIKGIFVVFVLLAIMIPILGIFDTGLASAVCDSLDSSYFARTLYDNNIFVLVVRDFLV